MRRRTKSPVMRIAILSLIVLAAGGYFWLRAGDGLPEPDEETGTVTRRTLDRTVEATGVIRPRVGAEIEVGSRISGIVRSIPVEVGDAVQPGDLLARIDPTELQAQMDQALADLDLAEAQLEMARTTYERTTALDQRGIVSASELDSAGRDLEVARARVALEKARARSAAISLGFTEIRAPISGVIAEITTREGETVAASFSAPTFVTIVDLDRLEVQAYVDETDIGRIFAGQTATFAVDTYPEAEFTGRVTAINPKAEIQNGVVNYIVLMTFDGQKEFTLRPEMTARVALQVEKRPNALTVPRRAIRRGQGRTWVRVRRAGKWIDQSIETGWRTDSQVEVEGGVSEGETVELNPE